MQNFIKNIETNKYENIIENTLKTLSSREAKYKALISTTILAAIKVAEQYDFPSFQLDSVPGALVSLKFITLSAISSKTIIASLKNIIPNLKEELDDKTAKKLENGLTFIISLLNYLVLDGADGSMLIAVVLSLCSVMISSVSYKYKDINANIITLNCIADIDFKNSLNYAIGVPIMCKLLTAHKKEYVWSLNDKTNKTYIPFKLLRAGETPVIVAGYIVSLLPQCNTKLLMSVLCCIFNMIIGYDVDGKQVSKELSKSSKVINGVRNVEEYIEKQIIYSNLIGGVILAVLVALNPNIGGIIVIGSTIERLYNKFKAEINMANKI